MLRLLGKWWRLHRNPRLLFPALGRRWKTSQRSTAQETDRMKYKAMARATKPMSTSTVQNAVKWAVAASGIKKRVTPHTLRHCYATHLLDQGVSLRHISSYLGHASLNQTLVYVHLTHTSELLTQDALLTLYKDVISPQRTNSQRG
jgi:site-specific recombinase XerD